VRFGLVAVCCLLALARPLSVLADDTKPASENPLFIDFSQYWTAASALREGQNPYDPEIIAQREREVLPGLTEPILQWNPPVLFPLTIPFSFLPYEMASFLWAGSLLALTAWILQLLLARYGQGRISPKQGIIYLFGLLLFFPLWESIRFGQVSPVLLAGFWGFIACRESRNPTRGKEFLAGLCLSLTAIKPHLLYLIYLVVALEALRWRRFREPLGFLSGLLILGGIPLLWRASLWEDYLGALQAMPVYFQTPTLGSLLHGLDTASTWLRFLPTVVTGVIAAFLLARRQPSVVSEQELLLLSALSLLTSPYGWVFDQILLMPLVVFLLGNSGRQLLPALGCIVISALAFPWSGRVEMQHFWWYPLGLGVLCTVALKMRNPGVTATLFNESGKTAGP